MPFEAVAAVAGDIGLGDLAGSLAAPVVSGLMGQVMGGGSQKPGAQAAAGYADPFASQRPQYQQQLQDMMTKGFSPQDPSYQWRFDQGQQGVERSMGAKGLLNSGNRLTELTQFGQDMASQEYGAQFARLSGLAGANSGSPGTAGQIMGNASVSDTNAANTFAGQIAKPLVGWGQNLISGGGGGGGGGGQFESDINTSGFSNP